MTPAGATVSTAYGTATSLVATPTTGYSFDAWTLVTGAAAGVAFGDATKASTTVALTSGDATIKANFKLNSYTLTVQAGTGGSVTAPANGTANVSHGADTTITAAPTTGAT